MIDTFRFFLSQSPPLWVAIGCAFVLLGLWHARVTWCRYVDRLRLALEEQRLLLEERTQVEAEIEAREEAASGRANDGSSSEKMDVSSNASDDASAAFRFGGIPTKNASEPYQVSLDTPQPTSPEVS